MKSITFDYRSVQDIFYNDEGHYILKVPAFFTSGAYRNDKIDFVFDTGAYITVVARQTAIRFGWDKLTPLVKNIPLTGFAGSCEGDLRKSRG